MGSWPAGAFGPAALASCYLRCSLSLRVTPFQSNADPPLPRAGSTFCSQRKPMVFPGLTGGQERSDTMEPRTPSSTLRN